MQYAKSMQLSVSASVSSCKSARYDNKENKSVVTLVVEKLAYVKETTFYQQPLSCQFFAEKSF